MGHIPGATSYPVGADVDIVQLTTNTTVKLLSHRSFRFRQRRSARIVDLINQYSDPFFCELVGERGEQLVLDGFATAGFRVTGRGVNTHQTKKWTRSNENLDFIFERDGRYYGVEVKNTLQYIEEPEFKSKLDMCEELGITPVFAVRMLPKTWVETLRRRGGYAMIMEWQMYPRSHVAFAAKVREELGLKVDTPRHLKDTTVGKLLKYYGHV